MNSYKRYRPGTFAPTGIAWSYDNRTAGFRVVGGGPSLRVECRIPGADANPYLVYAALLSAGLDGIENRMSAPEPVLMDPGDIEADERERKGIERLPTNLQEATDALAADEVLIEAMGEVLSREYLLIKSADWEHAKEQDVESELRQFIYRY